SHKNTAFCVLFLFWLMMYNSQAQVIDLRKSLEQSNAAAAAAAAAMATARPLSTRRSRSRSYHDASVTANALINELDELSGDPNSAQTSELRERARTRSRASTLPTVNEDQLDLPTDSERTND